MCAVAKARNIKVPKSWFEPFLWIHVAGISIFPFWMGLCLLGLASGTPLLPSSIELVAIALLGIGPVLAMQLLQPFNIFSLLCMAVPTHSLDEDRLRILGAFRTREQRFLSVAIAALLFCFLIDAYHLAPLVEALSPVHSAPGVGLSRLAIAAFGFFAANLFLQVPLAALRVMVMPEDALLACSPVDLDDVADRFTTFGWQTSILAPANNSDSS